MQKDPISVHVDTPIDEVAQIIEKYDLVAIPVLDSIGRLVGQITVDDVMDEVREQSERDYQLASGLSQDVETDDNVLRQTTARLPWLLIGMIGGIGNSMILGNFDSTFAAHPEMALYIPLIGGTGGNVGTQSSALVVQGLANSSLDAKNTFKQVSKEAVVALINATIISLLVYTYIYPFRSNRHSHLFGIHQSVLSSDVCLHLRYFGSNDTRKDENRSGHSYRTVYCHYERYHRHDDVYGDYGVIIVKNGSIKKNKGK